LFLKYFYYLCGTIGRKEIFIEHRKIFQKIFDGSKKVSYLCKTKVKSSLKYYIVA
jgi:hypothetical protein